MPPAIGDPVIKWREIQDSRFKNEREKETKKPVIGSIDPIMALGALLGFSIILIHVYQGPPERA